MSKKVKTSEEVAQVGTISANGQAEIGEIVRQYLVANPEILRDAATALDAKQAAEEAAAQRLAVKENREEPIKHLALILSWDEETAGEVISGAIENGFLIKDKVNKGQWTIAQKTLRFLKLKGTHRV